MSLIAIVLHMAFCHYTLLHIHTYTYTHITHNNNNTPLAITHINTSLYITHTLILHIHNNNNIIQPLHYNSFLHITHYINIGYTYMATQYTLIATTITHITIAGATAHCHITLYYTHYTYTYYIHILHTH